jgi:hypothetical protein
MFGKCESGDVNLVDRDTGLQVRAVVDEQHRVLDLRPILGAQLEFVWTGGIGDDLLDVCVLAHDLLGDVGPDPCGGRDVGPRGLVVG